MSKKVINVLVSSNTEESSKEYLRSIFEDCDVVFFDYNEYKRGNINLPKDLDITLVDGTKDINPEYYSEIPGKYTDYNPAMDSADYNMMYKGKNNYSLLLGFERGAHLVSVYSGASIIQHVEGHKAPHEVEFLYRGIALPAPSNHHQMMYPYDLRDDAYDIIGHSRHYKSETYLNGKNNEKMLPKDFLEPEVIYYNNNAALAIQGHPMKEGTSDVYKKVIGQYIIEYLDKRPKRKVLKRLVFNPE